ncbi:hypothetical protein [Streptomyces blattellae]|uniref:hypothetical protein n=1 Tax=Streptomyces blattellae TaxID=2569855 RepID=UPI0012B996D3|nr:hypothetical protein [Streptomyces blattellae]
MTEAAFPKKRVQSAWFDHEMSGVSRLAIFIFEPINSPGTATLSERFLVRDHPIGGAMGKAGTTGLLV